MQIKVMIIDDAESLLKVMSIFLKRNNCKVRTFVQASDALECLEQWEPDVLLVDIQMPVMDGFAFLQQRKDRHLCPATKVVIFTGRSDPQDQLVAKNYGADAFLAKPYMREELLSLVQLLSSENPI